MSADATPALLEDYIVLIEDALPAPFCERLLDEFRDSAEWNATLVASGQVNRAVRHADAISLSERAVIERHRPHRARLDQELHRYTAAAVKKYNERFPRCRITRDSGFELLRYPTGGFYTEHTDSYHALQRELACSFVLNDDFSGGEFAFFQRRKIVDVPKGAALLFPASFMYPHEVLTVRAGFRYSIVTWFS